MFVDHLEVTAIEIGSNLVGLIFGLSAFIYVAWWMKRNPKKMRFSWSELLYLAHLVIYSTVLTLHWMRICPINLGWIANWSSGLRVHSVLMILGYYFALRSGEDGRH